jgi:hypothetical protein
MSAVVALSAGAVLFLVSGAVARELDPQMRQNVIFSCSADAYRLCPQSLGTEREAVECMKRKRRELGPACRTAYDKVVRILAK